MTKKIYSKIIGTGSYIPSTVVKNNDFLNHEFYEKTGEKVDNPNEYIVQKFEEITTIQERKYIEDDQQTSDIAYKAAAKAIENANIDKETLDHIIVAHNFADVPHGSNRKDILPALASRVKHMLEIENPQCVAYDMIFGCPGWVQAMIQANYYIKSGDAKRVMVIGADALSRILDPHDRDSMIFSDGAGATILEGMESENPIGILGHQTRSDTLEYAKLLYMGKSNKKDYKNLRDHFIKMDGRKLYTYALQYVPTAIHNCLEKTQTPIDEVKKILIHQANGKMDDAIISRLYKLYGIKEIPEFVMPMNIKCFGNSSVATVPTLLDQLLRNNLNGHKIQSGDTIVLTSVGAGMNINAIIYKLP